MKRARADTSGLLDLGMSIRLPSASRNDRRLEEETDNKKLPAEAGSLLSVLGGTFPSSGMPISVSCRLRPNRH